MGQELGTYEMEEGQRSVQVAGKSSDGGQVFADAVASFAGRPHPQRTSR